MRLEFVCCIAFLFSNPIWAEGPHHEGTLSSVNVGIRYSSVFENRGVILYRDFQIDPVLGIFLFDDRLEFLADSIGYRDFIVKDVLRLRSRFVSLTDKPFFPAYKSIKNGLPSRPDTYEWSSQAELFLPGYNSNYALEVDLSYAKDIATHHGNYFELQSKIKLFDFRLPRVGTKIEPNLYASAGWGDSNHNLYFYGPAAGVSGFNNLSYGIWFALPEEADRYYPIIQIKHFETIGRFRQGQFAEGRSDGWLFSFIATAGIL